MWDWLISLIDINHLTRDQLEVLRTMNVRLGRYFPVRKRFPRKRYDRQADIVDALISKHYLHRIGDQVYLTQKGLEKIK